MKFCAVILLLLVAGCASSDEATRRPSLNQVSMHMAYTQGQEQVQQAYREALQEMGLEVLADAPGRLQALQSGGDVPTSLTITLGPADTLTTGVRIVSDYVFRGEQFEHYPYELAYKAHKALTGRAAFPYIFPQAAYPAGASDCSVPVPENPEALVIPDGVETIRRLRQHLRYTDEAQRQGIEGRVYTVATVDETGMVTCAVVVAGLPAGLNEQAISALTKTRFQPFLYEGKPVAATISLPITFRLR